MGDSSILMDFAKAYRQAERLEEVSQQLNALADSQLSSSLQSVSEAWKGESAANYINKGARLQEKIKDTAKNVMQSAETVRTITRRLEAAEEFAKSLIK